MRKKLITIKYDLWMELTFFSGYSYTLILHVIHHPKDCMWLTFYLRFKCTRWWRYKFETNQNCNRRYCMKTTIENEEIKNCGWKFPKSISNIIFKCQTIRNLKICKILGAPSDFPIIKAPFIFFHSLSLSLCLQVWHISMLSL